MGADNGTAEQEQKARTVSFCFRLVVVSSNNQKTAEAVLEKFDLRIKEAHCHVLDLEQVKKVIGADYVITDIYCCLNVVFKKSRREF